jgi:uncharacterized protein
MIKEMKCLKKEDNIRYIIFLLLFTILLNISIVSAAVPKIEPYVNDFAHLLTQDEITKLNLQADLIEQNTSYEIAMVTVQNTEGQDRIEYANKIGDENGVGKKDKDNGVVILWSVEDGGAIATGRYSESILNDAKVARIGKAARPLFDEGKYYEAFSQILTEIDKEIVASQDGSVTNSTGLNPNGNDKDGGIDIILVIFVIVGAFYFLKLLGASDLFSGLAIGSVLSSGGSSSSSSSSGGSFGGGSFGGGGSKF